MHTVVRLDKHGHRLCAALTLEIVPPSEPPARSSDPICASENRQPTGGTSSCQGFNWCTTAWRLHGCMAAPAKRCRCRCKTAPPLILHKCAFMCSDANSSERARALREIMYIVWLGVWWARRRTTNMSAKRTLGDVARKALFGALAHTHAGRLMCGGQRKRVCK